MEAHTRYIAVDNKFHPKMLSPELSWAERCILYRIAWVPLSIAEIAHAEQKSRLTISRHIETLLEKDIIKPWKEPTWPEIDFRHHGDDLKE